MGLFDFIKGRAAARKEPTDQLALLGADESRTGEFLELIAKSKIWVLGEAQEAEIEESDGAKAANADKITTQIEKQIAESKKVRTTADLKVHTLKIQDYTVLPFFTSQEFIGVFAKRSGVTQVTTFVGYECAPDIYECAPDILVREDLWRLPALMNPQSKFTRVFGAEDKAALVKLLSGKQT